MAMFDNLKSILLQQKENLLSLEKEIVDIEENDLVSQNNNLKVELEKFQTLFNSEKAINLKISEENKKLKNALYEQIYNEKIQILNFVNKRMDVYFKSNIDGEMNRLLNFELSSKKRIDEITKKLKGNIMDDNDEMYKKIHELESLLDKKLTTARSELAKLSGGFSENSKEEFKRLKQEQVSEDEIKSRLKQNNIESFIGLNILNKLGILILIIGVIAVSQFTYYRLPDTLKSVFIFMIGIVFLVAGEFLNRKKPNIFSMGITSGGIAILYVALSISYFKFGILNMYPALGLCVLITTGAFILSQRYNSQTISIFAMIGGYLPIFSISGSKTMGYGAMVYFVILNVLALIIAINKKWIVSAFIGFALNALGSIYILSIMLSPWPNYKLFFSKEDLITIIYIVFAFIVYTLIPVAGSYKKKIGFKNSDIALLALNTFISALLMYITFYSVGLSDYTGLLAVIFASIYISLGRFVEKLMVKEQKARALFYLTGLTFTILIIPFQFDKVWLSLGWLIEGIVLLSYGIYKDIKDFKRAGFFISMLCVVAFLIFDVTNYDSSLFVYKYFAITLGSIIVLATLIIKRNLTENITKIFKYAVAINIWIFLIYLIGAKLKPLLSNILLESAFDLDYLIMVAMILVSFLVAYIIPRIRIICDRNMKIISAAIYIIGIITNFCLNFTSPVDGYLSEVPLAISIVATALLVIIALLSLLALRDLMLALVVEQKFKIEWYPLLISFYFVLILTQNLITQYNLGFNNAVISIIYLITATLWITFGFIKRYVFIRRFGLSLSILSVAKLFLIDLSFLSQGYRIVSYFIFGMVLIGISFVYQHFSKKIDELSEEGK